jgi:transcriptional regulator with PAS, ATPase and Fis domain
LAFHLRRIRTCAEVAVTEIDPEVQRLFCESSWPGNVRRLENAIISALANGDPQRAIIVTADLPDWLREPLPEPVDGADQPLQARKKTTRQDTR